MLDANPTTPGDKPQLKNIIIKNVPDPATRRLLIQQGDADIARELGADQTDTLKTSRASRCWRSRPPSKTTWCSTPATAPIRC